MGVKARTPVRQRAQADMAIRGENPIVIPANVGTESLSRAMAGPSGVSVHPDALALRWKAVLLLRVRGGWSRSSPRP
jgi:hypothetical protein